MNSEIARTISPRQLKSILAFYRDDNVRQRIFEFCGGDRLTADYLVGFGEQLVREGYRRPLLLVTDKAGMVGLMEQGLDLFRSVRDRKSTIAVWDVEYFNLDTWLGLYRDQEEYFELMEPSYLAIEELFSHYAIAHINDSTSSGYHFVSRIPFSHPVHRRLERIGHLEPELTDKYALRSASDRKRVRATPRRAALGYSGIGRLHEYLSHRVILQTRGLSPIPVTISDTAIHRRQRGREGMSMDITQYADPLYMRDIRTTFSTHQKHKVYIGRVGLALARRMPVYATLPRQDLGYRELFHLRRNLNEAAKYAGQCCGLIPAAAEGWGRLISDYRRSSLFSFHREFDSVPHHPRRLWKSTYLALDLSRLPPCVAHPIRNANWSLLSPTNLQNICRVLLAEGWLPSHIGGLLRAHYEEDLNWDTDWQKYDASCRANFWARIYCGMLHTGADDLSTFSCAAHQQRGFCPCHWCGFRLEDYRDRLEARGGPSELNPGGGW